MFATESGVPVFGVRYDSELACALLAHAYIRVVGEEMRRWREDVDSGCWESGDSERRGEETRRKLSERDSERERQGLGQEQGQEQEKI